MQIWKSSKHGVTQGLSTLQSIFSSSFQIDACLEVMTSAARTIIEATEDWGPGPPPFRVPPPPLPPFMLPDDLEDREEFCQSTLKPSLDSHLDVCDTTFVSSKHKSLENCLFSCALRGSTIKMSGLSERSITRVTPVN